MTIKKINHLEKSIFGIGSYEEIEKKIEEVDILSDFDGTMIKEESAYLEILAYFFHCQENYIPLLRKIVLGYGQYQKKKDLHSFYSLLEGCPIEVLDSIVNRLHQNKKWDELIEQLGSKKVGIVSRNNQRILSKYLENPKYPNLDVRLIAANIPKIEKGIYTGEVKLIVSNNNLADFVRKKDYICREEEKRILEKDEEIRSENRGNEFFTCYKKKIF